MRMALEICELDDFSMRLGFRYLEALSIGEMLVPGLLAFALELLPTNFLLSNFNALCSIFKHLVILSLPAASVGSPVLFLALLAVLVQVMACYHS